MVFSNDACKVRDKQVSKIQLYSGCEKPASVAGHFCQTVKKPVLDITKISI